MIVADSKRKKPKVAVLMSTFNGERYVKQQIESILSQKGVEITLYIRDDGSTDQTKCILDNYCSDKRVRVLYSDNIGCGESFWELMCTCDKSDYYAFSDQDDVWLDDKLIRAVEAIRKKSCISPVLYCANFYLVDENLNMLKQEREYNMGKLTYYNLIITNLRACGNTMVWNDELHRLLIRNKDMKTMRITFHDIWVEFFAAMLGDIIIDSERVILYRQHSANVSGGSRRANVIPYILARITQVSNRLFGDDNAKHYEEYRALYCYRYYRDLLTDDKIVALKKVIEYRKSLKNLVLLLFSNVCNNTPLKVKMRVILHRV